MVEIPGIEKRPFYREKWVAELVAVVPPVIAAAVTAFINYKDQTKRTFAYVLFGGIAWLILASILKVFNAYHEDRKEKDKQSHDGLLGTIHVLYGTVSRHLNFAPDTSNRLRVTIHRVVREHGKPPEELEQLLPYVGGKGGDIGRKFSIRSGIIGKAAREGTPLAAYRENDDYEAFIRELVTKWAYTEEEARRLTIDRKSWMAVPISGKNNIILGVVYLDSNEKEFFTEEVIKLVIEACSGIASYISERYK